MTPQVWIYSCLSACARAQVTGCVRCSAAVQSLGGDVTEYDTVCGLLDLLNVSVPRGVV